MIRLSLFAAAALIAAACGSTVDVSDGVTDVANETTVTQQVEADTGAVEDTEQTNGPEASDADSTESDPVGLVDEATTTTPPPNPEPVTATTVHETTSDDFPDIIAAQATLSAENTWRFDVTVSSTYDTPERYADAWRVVGPDGTQFGIRVLTHDHASEQPFTRTQSGIEIPADVTAVTIEGRDLANGWGGGSLELDLTGEL